MESFGGRSFDKTWAIKHAMLHVTKRVLMGREWVQYDELGETLEHLKVKKGFENTVTEARSLFTTERSHGKRQLELPTTGAAGSSEAPPPATSQASSLGMVCKPTPPRKWGQRQKEGGRVPLAGGGVQDAQRPSSRRTPPRRRS